MANLRVSGFSPTSKLPQQQQKQQQKQHREPYLTLEEDAQLAALPSLNKVRQQKGMMSAAPAVVVVDTALQHFLRLDEDPLEHVPSAEEWQRICGSLLTRLSPADVDAQQSTRFQKFRQASIGSSGNSRSSENQALARYLTLYLPTNCSLHDFWPRQNAQEMVDRGLHDAALRYLDEEPLPDSDLIARIGDALRRIQTRF